MKHIVTGMLMVAVLGLCACSGDDTANNAGPTAEAGTTSTLSVSPNPMALSVGDSKQLKAEAVFADGSKEDVTENPSTIWTSNNPQTATVDSKGHVVGVNAGVTNVNVSFGGANRTVPITVLP